MPLIKTHSQDDNKKTVGYDDTLKNLNIGSKKPHSCLVTIGWSYAEISNALCHSRQSIVTPGDFT